MHLSIAELKRRLPEGAEFTAKFIGKNMTVARPGMVITRRRVVKQAATMITSVVGGEFDGKLVYCGWRGTTATIDNENKVTLSVEDHDGIADAFVEMSDITLPAAKEA